MQNYTKKLTQEELKLMTTWDSVWKYAYQAIIESSNLSEYEKFRPFPTTQQILLSENIEVY